MEVLKKNVSYVKKKECNTVLILVTFRVQDKTTRNRERMTKCRPSGAGGFSEITVTKQEGQGREVRGDYTSLHLPPPPQFLLAFSPVLTLISKNSTVKVSEVKVGETGNRVLV